MKTITRAQAEQYRAMFGTEPPDPIAEDVPALPSQPGETRVVSVKYRVPFDTYVGHKMRFPNQQALTGPTDGKFANPYRTAHPPVGFQGYVDHLLARVTPGGRIYDPAFRAAVLGLKGQTLACWCDVANGAVCHGMVLACFVEGYTEQLEALRKVFDRPQSIPEGM